MDNTNVAFDNSPIMATHATQEQADYLAFIAGKFDLKMIGQDLLPHNKRYKNMAEAIRVKMSWEDAEEAMGIFRNVSDEVTAKNKFISLLRSKMII